MTDNPVNKPEKKPFEKRKGPIRFEAIIPFCLVVGLIVFYLLTFLDTHLRWGMEYGLTQMHGAEVNIESVSTDFLKPGIAVYGIQVTDKNKPERNIITLEKVSGELLWDALLRLKFVIPNSSIEGIKALTPRDKPGRVLPPGDPSKSVGGRIENELNERAQKQINGNVLGDVANVLGGGDPMDQLKNIQSELKAEARAKEIEAALKEKEKLWGERLKSLPESKEFEGLANEAKALKFDTSNPKQFSEDLQKMQKIIKEGEKKFKEFQSASNDLQGDVNGFNKNLKDLEKLAAEDVADLQKRFNIPEINTAEISKGLFGSVFRERIAEAGKYAAMGREYIPKKKKEEQVIKPKARGEGRDFRFRVKTGYPYFWLKNMTISSKADGNKYSGNFDGAAQNFSTAPKIVGIPATLSVKGGLPNLEISGIDVTITVDHTGEKPKELIRGVVASFPIQGRSLSDSKDVMLKLNSATGQARFTGQLEGRKLYFKIINDLNNAKFESKAKSPILDEVLRNVIADLPVLNIESTAQGNFKDFRLDIRSNLGKELAKGIEKQVKAKIDEAKKKLQDFVDNKVGAEKAKLQNQYNQAKAQVDKALGKKKDEINKTKKETEQSLNEKKKKGEKKGKKQLEKDAGKLLKGLGI